MLDEFVKALGPWPLLQAIFGVIILGGGAWAVYRGTQKNNAPKELPSTPDMEELRADWTAREQLRNIEQNSGMMVRQLEHLNEAIRQLTAALWSNRPPHI